MNPRHGRVWSSPLRAAVLCLFVARPGAIAAAMAQDAAKTPPDQFAGEPQRPKAKSPISFAKSWGEARAQAKRTGQRLMTYFTSDSCGWCRALEKRTFTDAEVVELSKQFVCVEVDVREEKNLRVADEYRIDTIPRIYIFTPDGRIIDRRTGYLPAAEFAAWLKGVGTTAAPIAPAGQQTPAPAPVGAPSAEADVVIWSVDATSSINRWSDSDWTSHAHLLRLLRAAGFRPRVEHLAREDFPARWDAAESASKVPDLITADNWAGLILELESKGRLVSLRSDRLTWMTDVASCPDFKGRSLFLVTDSQHKVAARRTVNELLRPGPEMSLPGVELPEAAGRAEAALVARRAVVAYVAGDPERLKQVAASSSPQLARCTRPGEYRRGWNVEAGSVELRGNDVVAFAKVEMHFQGTNWIGADPVLVVLSREDSQWKAFSVSSDFLSIQALPALSRLQFRPRAGSHAAPPPPRLVHPDDGGRLGEGGRSFAWEIPAGSAPLAAQICEVFLDDKESSWPESRIKVFGGEPRSQSLQASETATNVTGVTADKMRWCVWSIGADGRISASEVRSYRRIDFKY